jgi:hypothetical protein
MTTTSGGKPRLDAGMLTPADMRRARERLGGDPYEYLTEGESEDRQIFLIWCYFSRTRPDFTLDDAANTPYGEFDMSGDDEPDPPIPSPDANGVSPASSDGPASPNGPTSSASAPSAAPTTA